ncbi:hypothetical protein [Methanococcoides sp.]|nr:hypothetical protein [Methanococcoides sp.]
MTPTTLYLPHGLASLSIVHRAHLLDLLHRLNGPNLDLRQSVGMLS